MVMGMSPLETTQVNCANSPESITGFPNVNGMICGGSKNTELGEGIISEIQCLPQRPKNTIYSQLS